jgi:hypothetical protein
MPPWEDGCFYLSKLPAVGAATPASTIAFSQLGQSSVQGLCEPVFLGDTSIEELAIGR